MAYHIITTRRDLGEYVDVFERGYLPLPTIACFSRFDLDYYDTIIKERRSIFTGLILNDLAERLIKDFNQRFSNIELYVLYKKKFREFQNSGRIWMEYSNYRWPNHIDLTSLYVLGIRYSPEYTPSSRYHLYVPLIQFMRVFSPMSRYEYHYEMAISVEPSIPGILEGHRTYGRQGDYGSWCCGRPSLQDFMNLDDPKLMNHVAEALRDSQYYASGLFAHVPYIPNIIPDAWRNYKEAK